MIDHFTNSKGLEVHCLPVSAEATAAIARNIEADFIARGEPLTSPARAVPKMGGGSLFEPLTNYIGSDDLTDEEKDLLTAHLSAMNQLYASQMLAICNLLCLEGIALDQVPEKWIKRQKLIGNPLPTDEDELRLQYIKSALIVTFPMGNEGDDLSDYTKLNVLCKSLAFTGLTQEAEDRIRNSFRGSLARSENGAGHTPEGSLAGNNGGSLAVQSDVLGGEDSQGLREGAELVQKPKRRRPPRNDGPRQG